MTTSDDILKRIPPQSLEAEQSVLGAVLIDEAALDRALDIITAEDFYRESHREIFKAMVELVDRKIAIDAVTLTDWLRMRGALEQIGGPAYLAELATVVPTTANVTFYARIVHDKAVLRSLGSVATDIASSSYEAPVDVDGFLDEAEQRIFELTERRQVRRSFRGMAEVMRGSLQRIEQLADRRELVTGVSTGFLDLDRITAGLQPTDLIIIAARPSVGKTALALNIAAHAAMQEPKEVVAFFSLEMSIDSLAIRLLCSEARIDGARVRSGFIGDRDYPKLAQAAAALSESELWIDDASDSTLTQIRAKCRRLKRDRGRLGLIVVDYLQLIRSTGPVRSREQEIAGFSRGLKSLAKDLKVPIVLISQLNRQVESRQNKRPILADLRESGAIEQDADVIAFIYREEMYSGRECHEPGVAEVIVAKQRNGPTDVAKLAYISNYTRFENYTPEELFPEGQ